MIIVALIIREQEKDRVAMERARMEKEGESKNKKTVMIEQELI